MTQFEVMLLNRLDGMTAEVGRLATAVGRLEERQIAQDDRLDELERTPPPGSRQYQSKARTVARDAGLAISGGTITAVFTALLNLLTAATPPAPPRAPAAPTHVETPR